MNHTTSLFLFISLCQVGAVSIHAQQTSVKVAEGAGQKEKDTEQELIQLEKQWAEAGVKGDAGFFERIAAADYVIVDCDGSVRNKQQEIANFRQETQTSSTVEDMKVRVYGGSAVVVGIFTITGNYAGQPMNLSGTFTDSWIRPNRTWQLVSTQNTCKTTEDAQAGNPPDSFFIAKEKEDWEALKNKDKVAAARLLADDFVGMYDTGYSTKSEWIKQIDGRYTVDDYTIQDIKVLRPSPTTTLLLYKATCKGTGEWSEFCSRPEYISDLLVERNGQWVALFSQDTQATGSQGASVRMDEKYWPHGFHGDAYPHGTVSSRSPAAIRSSALEQTIIDKEKEAIEAVEKNDLKHFASLIADDFLFIGDDGVWGRREYLKSFEEDVTWENCKMEDVGFSSLSENAAIISYKQTWTGSDHGKRFEIVIYTHGHWEKRRGQWMVTLWQDTPAEKSSTPAAETKPTLILPPSPGRSELKTAMISRERALLEALKRNECTTVSGFMADGLVAIGGTGIKGRAEYMKLCETPRRWTEYELEQVQVYPARANSVVVVKKVIFSGADQGKQFKSVEYGHEDWERHNGDWQITALQDTRQAAQ